MSQWLQPSETWHVPVALTPRLAAPHTPGLAQAGGCRTNSCSSSVSFSLLWGIRTSLCTYIYTHTYKGKKKKEICKRQTNSAVHIHVQSVRMKGLITQMGTFPVKRLHYLSSHSRVQLLTRGLQRTLFSRAKVCSYLQNTLTDDEEEARALSLYIIFE